MMNKTEKLQTTYRVYIPKEGYRTFKVSKKFAKTLARLMAEHEDTLSALAKL